jgi:hypothetical protein
MPPAGFEPGIPAGERLQTHALDSSATGIGLVFIISSHKLTPRIKVLPEKLTDPQLLKKFSAFYGTRRFITAFTGARHLSLS